MDRKTTNERDIPGLPYLHELKMAPVDPLLDVEGREYYLYDRKVFGKYVDLREEQPDTDEVVFVVALPKGITDKNPEFDFPDASLDSKMTLVGQDGKDVREFIATVAATHFPDRSKHATGWIHFRNITQVVVADAQTPLPAAAASAAPAAST